uniref:Uncharacterized protein n=1 Tax=Timema tahoe TaxID=61484 RepID=A0A7R9IDS2_9NEOP|nr:unnamed protein product [Timema tahoe]
MRHMTQIEEDVGQMQTTDLEPEFLAPLENLTVTQGRNVHFTCVVNHLGTYKELTETQGRTSTSPTSSTISEHIRYCKIFTLK